jgi:hypothetical protein
MGEGVVGVSMIGKSGLGVGFPCSDSCDHLSHTGVQGFVVVSYTTKFLSPWSAARYTPSNDLISPGMITTLNEEPLDLLLQKSEVAKQLRLQLLQRELQF